MPGQGHQGRVGGTSLSQFCNRLVTQVVEQVERASMDPVESDSRQEVPGFPASFVAADIDAAQDGRPVIAYGCGKKMTKLEVKFEGRVPGLQEHRLSLSSFGPALNDLLRAMRRIGTSIVGDAVGTEVITGRLRDVAKQIDVEVTGLIASSTGISALVTFTIPQGEQIPLFADLPERVVDEFLDAVHEESRGVWRNSSVRRYLRSLPSGLTSQTYTAVRNGGEPRTITIGAVSLTELHDMPYLKAFAGSIIGVGFEPGKNEVRFRVPEGERPRQIALEATLTQVERALELRGSSVKGIALFAKQSRLLRLRAAAEPDHRPTMEDCQKHIFERWGVLLQRLAR